MRLEYRFSVALIKIYMFIFWNYQVIGRKKISFENGCIVCANHQSALDPPFLGTIVPFESYYMAKAELFRNSIFGALISHFNAIPVRRFGFSRGTIEKFISLIKQKKNVIIFPEGSRKSFTAKPGVAKIAWDTNATIYPVQIRNIKDFKSCFFRRKKLIFLFKEPMYAKNYRKLVPQDDYKQLASIILNNINSNENGNNNC